MHHHQSSPTRYIPMMSRTNASDQNLALQDQLEQLEHYVKQSAATGEAIHQVETGIWHRVLELGHQALGLYLSLQGDGDMGETLELENGEIVYRLPNVRRREYQSVFGDFSLPFTSIAQVIEHHRQHHAQALLIAACEQAIADGNTEGVVIGNPSDSLVFGFLGMPKQLLRQCHILV